MKCPQAVSDYFQAWNRQDARAVCGTLAAGGTYTDPTVPNGVTGSGFLAVTEAFMSAFNDLSFEVLAVIAASEESVAVQWMMRGTHTGPLGPVAAANRTVALPGVDIFRLRDGRIESIEGYYDTGTLNRQLGV